MSNIAWELIFIISGILLCAAAAFREVKGNWSRIAQSNFFILYFTSLIINIVIVEISRRGSMLFGDGYDYYVNAVGILNSRGFSLSTMLNPKIFLDVGQSWHFFPVWEFTLFVGAFGSTRCLALFHVFLTNICSLIWLKVFAKLKLERTGLIASSILTASLYIRNFTTPALKDAMVYFLFSYISYCMVEYYQSFELRSLIKTTIPLIFLVFTRMYLAVAIMCSIIILIIRNAKVMIKKGFSSKRLTQLLITMAIVAAAVIATVGGTVYKYAISWIVGAHYGLSAVLGVIKRVCNFVYGPLIINVINAQSLYYPSFIAAFVRLLATPLLIRGLLRINRHNARKCINIVLVIPFIICALALYVGGSESSIRQYLCFYPLLCILYALGIKRETDACYYEETNLNGNELFELSIHNCNYSAVTERSRENKL